MSEGMCSESVSPWSHVRAGTTLLSWLIPAVALVWFGTGTLADPLLSGRFLSYRFDVSLSEGMKWARPLSVMQILSAAAIFLLWGRHRSPSLVSSCFAALPMILLLTTPNGLGSYACGCYGSLLGEGLMKFPITQIAISGSMFLMLIAHALMLSNDYGGTSKEVRDLRGV